MLETTTRPLLTAAVTAPPRPPEPPPPPAPPREPTPSRN